MLPKDHDRLIYELALLSVPEVGTKTIRALLSRFGSAEAIFNASPAELRRTNGVGEIRSGMFKSKLAFEKANKELEFIEKHHIKVLSFNSPDYPKRLRFCDDAPMLLYYKGNATLNPDKTITLIGTRKNTDYGQRAVEYLVEGLNGLEDTLIVSGLASGIDAIAHRAALKNGLPTVGVLGHGLDIMYPFTNRSLAAEMIEHGGLLTEFPSGTKPDKQNFPIRNRIVAGLSDVTVVVESEVKGGAMITAYMALSYNRDVAAFPGKIFELKSQGPNHLIKRNMAAAITSAADLVGLMNWKMENEIKTTQTQLFVNLSNEEKMVIDALQDKEKLHTDELLVTTAFKSSQLASILLQLEMQGLVKSLPGKCYRVN